MRNITFTYIKPITLLVVITILFQCCKVYEKQPVSLEDAIGPDKKKVKIITSDNRVLLFDSLYYRNDEIVGLLSKSTKKQLEELKINNESIQSVYLLNINKSKTRTIILMVLLPLGVITGAMIIVGVNAVSEFEKLMKGN